MPRPLALVVLLAACANTRTEATRACNGDPALCDRPLDQVVLPATHNAMSSADDGFAAPNQLHTPRVQLEDGIRGMLLDTYDDGGELLLCHVSCAFASIALADVLGDLAAFLDAHPDEVLTLVFEDHVTPEQTEAAFREAGLIDRAIVPPSGDRWPTLGELIDADTRLLVTRESSGPGPAWYPSFYDLAFDTPYTFRSQDDFTCDLNRGAPSHPLFLINHWIEDPLPDREKDAVANGVEVLGQRVADCTERWGRPPTMIAVDHYDTGDLFEVVRAANGLAP